jgi:hypothetical protein
MLTGKALNALQAVGVVQTFWQALANDDDDTLRSILEPEMLEITARPGLPIAPLVRKILGKTREECAAMDVLSLVYLGGDGSCVVGSRYGQSEPLSLPVVRSQGSWRIGVAPAPTLGKYETIDVSLSLGSVS